MALIFLMKFVQQNVNVALCPKTERITEMGFASREIQQTPTEHLLSIRCCPEPGELEIKETWPVLPTSPQPIKEATQ